MNNSELVCTLDKPADQNLSDLSPDELAMIAGGAGVLNFD